MAKEFFVTGHPEGADLCFIASDYDFTLKQQKAGLLRTAKSQTTLTENTVEDFDLGGCGCYGVREEQHCDNSTAKKPAIAMKANAK